jgi:hypothetical protein
MFHSAAATLDANWTSREEGKKQNMNDCLQFFANERGWGRGRGN